MGTETKAKYRNPYYRKIYRLQYGKKLKGVEKEQQWARYYVSLITLTTIHHDVL